MATGEVLRTLGQMTAKKSLTTEIADLQRSLAELDRKRESVLAALEQLKLQGEPELQAAPSSQVVRDAETTTALSNADKITLFRSLFRGRDDVFPRRWENSKTDKAGYAPACRNEWICGVCEKPRIKCSNCPNQAFVPISDEVVRSHLQGRDVANPRRAEPFIAGVYPLTTEETCWFLAADFDKQCWQRDALAFLATCRERSVPAALERSRSARAPMSGSFSRNQCLPRRRVDLVPIWLLKRWIAARISVSNRMIGSFPARTPCLPAGSAI